MIFLYLSLIESSEDETVFIRLYHKNLPILTKVGCKYFKSNSYVEDALQSTWESVILNFKKISNLPNDEITPYLVTVMKNKCKDILRREKKYALEITDEEIAGEEEVFDKVFTQLEYAYLVSAIREIPDHYREILERRLILEQKNSEIAKIMSISEGLVAKRYARAKAMLIGNLRNEEHYD